MPTKRWKYEVWKLWLDGPRRGTTTREKTNTRFSVNGVYGMAEKYKVIWRENL